MKVIRILVFLFLLLSSLSHITYAATKTNIEITSNNIHVGKTARIYDDWRINFIGSGFFIEGGYVITNAHVVTNKKEIQLIDGKKDAYKGVVIAKDFERDLALVKTEVEQHDFFEIATQKQSDEQYTTITNSVYVRFVDKVGVIKKSYETYKTEYEYTSWSKDDSKTVKIKNERTRDLYSFNSEPGNSGSGVFNTMGQIVGVIMARSKYGEAIGVQLSDLEYFIDKYSKESFNRDY